MVDDNGRILAVLQNEMQHVRADISEMRQEVKDLSMLITQIANDQLNRIIELEKDKSATDERWIAHKEVHAREVKNQHVFAGVLSAALSTISGIVSALAGRP
jgi:phosphoenolpyruvate carboxylase